MKLPEGSDMQAHHERDDAVGTAADEWERIGNRLVIQCYVYVYIYICLIAWSTVVHDGWMLVNNGKLWYDSCMLDHQQTTQT